MSAPSTPRSYTISHPSPIRVAVCGAIGTVGTLTVHALLHTGVNLHLRAGCEAEMMQSDAVRTYEGLAVEVVQLNYEDDASVEAVLTGVERVFVILPWRRGMVELMERFLRIAKKTHVAFVLKMSSIMTTLDVPPEALPQMIRDHIACDALLQSSGLPYAVVCPSILFDNLIKFQGDVIRLDRALYGLGRGEAAFTDARDVADCVVSVLLNAHRYHSRHLLLTGKEVVTGEQMATGMSRVYQTPVAHKVVTEAEMRQILTRRGIPPFMQDDLIAVERLANERRLTQITQTVKEVAGHPPRTLETFLAAYRSQLMPSFSLPQLSHFFM